MLRSRNRTGLKGDLPKITKFFTRSTYRQRLRTWILVNFVRCDTAAAARIENNHGSIEFKPRHGSINGEEQHEDDKHKCYAIGR